jgi:hypothetical protein
MKDKRSKTDRKGVALLIVLFIVMAITILSLGFLSRSDVELACGENMILRNQMDYLAESGLEHARGLILHSQEIASDYWKGDVALQLVDGSNDYYDVNVVKDVNEECNYQITCDAYRRKNGEKIGQSSLKAELRLNPCIAFWTTGNSSIPADTRINGDVYCGGSFTNDGVIKGDVFATGFSGMDPASGQKYGIDKAVGVTSPGLDIHNFDYITDPNGNVVINESRTVDGPFAVDCNLVIKGGTVKITAPKNSPALLVGNKLTLENGAVLEIDGFAQTANELSVDNGTEVKISGALFIIGTGGISGTGKVTITADPAKASLQIPPEKGGPITWSPAAGAFFRSIKRK